ncbi:MAG: hypothetical protein AVDCRST_MAG85-398, partial [uncultured Solirubrobacteraceae bacterium]
ARGPFRPAARRRGRPVRGRARPRSRRDDELPDRRGPFRRRPRQPGGTSAADALARRPRAPGVERDRRGQPRVLRPRAGHRAEAERARRRHRPRAVVARGVAEHGAGVRPGPALRRLGRPGSAWFDGRPGTGAQPGERQPAVVEGPLRGVRRGLVPDGGRRPAVLHRLERRKHPLRPQRRQRRRPVASQVARARRQLAGGRRDHGLRLAPRAQHVRLRSLQRQPPLAQPGMLLGRRRRGPDRPQRPGLRIRRARPQHLRRDDRRRRRHLPLVPRGRRGPDDVERPSRLRPRSGDDPLAGGLRHLRPDDAAPGGRLRLPRRDALHGSDAARAAQLRRRGGVVSEARPATWERVLVVVGLHDAAGRGGQRRRSRERRLRPRGVRVRRPALDVRAASDVDRADDHDDHATPGGVADEPRRRRGRPRADHGAVAQEGHARQAALGRRRAHRRGRRGRPDRRHRRRPVALRGPLAARDHDAGPARRHVRRELRPAPQPAHPRPARARRARHDRTARRLRGLPVPRHGHRARQRTAEAPDQRRRGERGRDPQAARRGLRGRTPRRLAARGDAPLVARDAQDRQRDVHVPPRAARQGRSLAGLHPRARAGRLRRADRARAPVRRPHAPALALI